MPVVAVAAAAPADAVSHPPGIVTALRPTYVMATASWGDDGAGQSIPTKFQVRLDIEGWKHEESLPVPPGDTMTVSYDVRLLAAPGVGAVIDGNNQPASDPLQLVSGPTTSGNLATVTYSVPGIGKLGKYNIIPTGPIVEFAVTPTKATPIRTDYEPITITWTSTLAGTLDPASLPVQDA